MVAAKMSSFFNTLWRGGRGVCAVAVLALALPAAAQVDWDAVPYVRHCDLQAVNANGTPAYAAGFPIRLVGVVLNNTQDWLDPTPAYDPSYHLFQMGGEAEFYVQAVDLVGTPYDVSYGLPFDDFGGTACWMGQNYGNHIMHQDPSFSYTDAEWTAELGRLNLYGGDGVVDPIQRGDLVEIRARAGLHYSGKYNVNEQHSPLPAKDFEIVRLEADYGLPEAIELTLDDLKTSGDEDIFDPTRQTGGERYQSQYVELTDVYVTTLITPTADTTITVTDGTRTFPVYFGLNSGFEDLEAIRPRMPFKVAGILDQSASDGQFSTDGYQLLVLTPDDVSIFNQLRPGDANGDGHVNIDDFIILKQNYNTTSGASVFNGDFNGDGAVNINDFIILKQHYNS